MKKYIIMFLAFALFSTSLVAATGNCPCLRPGEKGTLIKFLAREGTTDNVTFYPEDETPKLGSALTIYAVKHIENKTLIIENLTVTMYVDSVKVEEKKTSAGGTVQFMMNSPGKYDFRGGDASLSINLTNGGDANVVPGEINDSNDTGARGGSLNSGDSAGLNGTKTAALLEPGALVGSKKPKGAQGAQDYTVLLPVFLAVFAAALIYMFISRNKGSFISGNKGLKRSHGLKNSSGLKNKKGK